MAAAGTTTQHRQCVDGSTNYRHDDGVPMTQVPLSTRPVGFVILCPHCAQLHRVSVERVGLVIRAACGRGPIRVGWFGPA
jgi:hypothetical protein